MSKLRNLLYRATNVYHRLHVGQYEKRKIRSKEPIYEAVQLTPEQEQAIYSVYGKKIDTRWHRYYQAFTGKFDAKYLPEIYYSSIMEEKLSPRKIADVLQDKSLLGIIHGGGVNVPRTIIENCSGLYYNGNRTLAKNREAAQRIVDQFFQTQERAIIKPTVDTNSGANVGVLTSAEHIIGPEYRENYVVQEVIVNQSDVKALNPHSLNTFRIITYICDGELFCAPVILRMGRGESHLDNAHTGGIFVGVKSDGSLCPYAYSEYGERFNKHPYSNIVFDGYRIKNFNLLTETALKCHTSVPHIKMISWDLTLNQDGYPTLIEQNLYGQAVWISQIAHGEAIFGDNTEKMLLEYGIKKH